VARVERDHVERLLVVRVRGGREPELGREALGDLGPGLASVVAAVHADVVLLVHAVAVERRATSLWTQKPTSSCSAGQSLRRPLFRGVQVFALSVVSKRPMPWTIAQKRSSSVGSNISAEIPRCPGGWLAGSSQASLPGWPSRAESFDQVRRRRSTRRCPASRRRRAASVPRARFETFDIFFSPSAS
jgi:hypothetical protein